MEEVEQSGAGDMDAELLGEYVKLWVTSESGVGLF